MDSLRGRWWLLALVALGVLVFVVQFNGLTDRPIGYYLDESAFSWNAWSLVSTGADEHGKPWPLFFESFGDWKTAPLFYLLAGVYTVTGPSILAARVISASAGVVAVALLAALGYRVSRRPEVALLTGAITLLLPWTFEPTRLVFEAPLMVALTAGFLLVLHWRPPGSSAWSIVFLAVMLAALTYTYNLGRLLGPLFALGLAVYASRARWRPVLATWIIYGALLIPFVLFNLTTPDALLARLNEAGYLDRPLPEVVTTFVARLLGNLDPYRLLVSGDPIPRHHAPGIGGPVLVGVLGLVLIGLVVTLRRVREDPWSRYLLWGLAASFVPASLTLDPFHQHRLIAVPVFMIAVTIPAQDWLLSSGGTARAARRGAFALLAVVVLVQGLWFQVRYDDAARGRGAWFDPEYPRLLDGALATRADPIYLEDGTVPGYIHGYWYGALRGVPPERFVHLPRGARAPSGAIVLSSVADCTPCEELDAGGFFKLYRIP